MIAPRLAAKVRAAAGLLLVCAWACASVGPLPAPEGGSTAVPAHTALEFHQRAEAFYQRLLKRRFDTLETFSDPFLRSHFASIDVFFDYYADLASELSEAHFEKSRPDRVEIEEFLFEDPDHVRIQVRFVGGDGRPLRPNRTSLVRRDRWVRADRTWWLVPGSI